MELDEAFSLAEVLFGAETAAVRTSTSGAGPCSSSDSLGRFAVGRKARSVGANRAGNDVWSQETPRKLDARRLD